jgi:catechol 2,3-dioxygenase-like lactoylglutathione lyase family enzyme
MPATPRFTISLLTRDISRSVAFYRALSGFELVHSEDWYAVLAASAGSPFQLGLIDWTSEFVPRAARGTAQGAFIEIVVEDVPAALAGVRGFDIEIIEEPQPFGDMMRAVVRDLDGHVVDITTPHARYHIPPRQHVA